MALTTIPLPFGLRDVKLTPYTTDAATVLAGASVDLPNSRTMEFTENEEYSELRGDDKLVASHGSGPNVEWSLEAGGTPMEAIKVMYGGTISETGVTPNQKKEYDKLATHTRPYFKAEGQAISDSGGDFHLVLHLCKATDSLSGTLTDGEFWITGASGTGFPSRVVADLDKVWSWVQNETAVAIP